MFGLGWPEIAVMTIVAILIFGPKKIPELGTALGKTLRGFKEEIKTPTQETNQEEECDSLISKSRQSVRK